MKSFNDHILFICPNYASGAVRSISNGISRSGSVNVFLIVPVNQQRGISFIARLPMDRPYLIRLLFP